MALRSIVNRQMIYTTAAQPRRLRQQQPGIGHIHIVQLHCRQHCELELGLCSMVPVF